MKRIISLVLLLTATSQATHKADLTIFSFDRPLQLYALLESIDRYVTGLGTITVIYRTSTAAYAQAYTEVHDTFSAVNFVQQGENPQQDFKLLTLKSVCESPSEYTLFAVDDNIVKDYVDLSECIDALERTQAYGFYLKMGTNLRSCYMHYCDQPLPPLEPIGDSMVQWRFAHARLDWRYPYSLDMVLYRKKDVVTHLHTLMYHTPNQLEARLSEIAFTVLNRCGLCYTQSKTINIPLNIVQKDFKNRGMNNVSTQQLLQLWQSGLKMDITPLYQINNSAVHMEYSPTYLQRDIS